jgi:phospholipid/cholesterol/gamma-HCH transport system substrate-binding protein
MKPTRAIELGTGLFVLLGFAAVFFLVLQLSSREITWRGGYTLTAKFENIGSLKVGAPVSMGGVTVGRVESIDYDMGDYRALVRMRINPKYTRIPDDSDAAIFTAGLLGSHYIGITPGGSETFYKNGDQIQLTQSAVVLENLISKYLFSKAGESGSKGDEPAPPASKGSKP